MAKSLQSLLAIAVVLLSMALVGQAFEFENCGGWNSIGNFRLVEVSGCDQNKLKCELQRNTDVNVAITFTSRQDVSNLKAVVYGTVQGVTVPFDLPNDNACVNSGLACPLTGGTEYRYSTKWPVTKKYPKVVFNVQWELKSGDKVVVCVKFPARIQ